MIEQDYNDIVTEDLLVGNIDNLDYDGFIYDYRVLHCLLRKYKPKTVYEIGTNAGVGVNVIAAAVPDAKVYSLDLDFETMRQNSAQYPIGSEGEDRVGTAARFPYTQLRGDSMTFDYSRYPCEFYYVDGEHDSEHVSRETFEILKQNPRVVAYHDSDIHEVMKGILYGWAESPNCASYQLYKVNPTRISYLLKGS